MALLNAGPPLPFAGRRGIGRADTPRLLAHSRRRDGFRAELGAAHHRSVRLRPENARGSCASIVATIEAEIAVRGTPFPEAA